jgi:hypothetical protein
MATLDISVGESTEELIQFVTKDIDDSMLDEIEIDREVRKPDALASEPITTAVMVTLSTVAASAVLRLVERWLENRRQTDTLKIVASGFSVSDNAGKQLASLAVKHSNVSVSYGLAQESWKK